VRGVQTGRCGGARRRRGPGLVVGEGRGSSSERDGAATAATAAAAAARRRRFEFLLGYRRELDSEGIFGLLLGAKKKKRVRAGTRTQHL
jgi:hypothetical protein